ncbi:putative peroxygenase 5 [Capsicum baccatum]|uniref:Peroxygenase 5 n=1 Tax=Capsicum baccatum TaxID=33114 RepID=A0A2G2WTB7_CAPBA|nr:putative peroxygenase 5 [Capsicum baccatum]
MASSTSCSQAAEKIGNNHELTPLEKHVMFFDINNDGIIYPSETYQAFRKMGRGIFRSMFAAVLIHFTLSHKTRPGKCPSLLFPIVVENIKYAIHGSDSGAYDSEGRFVPEKFEEIFKKHANQNPDSLTYNEVKELLKTNRERKDYYGWANAFVDWKSLYDLGKSNHGTLTKETVRAVYDGSLFEQIAKEQASK